MKYKSASIIIPRGQIEVKFYRDSGEEGSTGGRAVVAMVHEGTHLAGIGVALCGEKDQFSTDKGRKIALGRAVLDTVWMLEDRALFWKEWLKTFPPERHSPPKKKDLPNTLILVLEGVTYRVDFQQSSGDRGITSCFIEEVKWPGKIAGVGLAICSKKDTFNAQKGKKVALARAVQNCKWGHAKREAFWNGLHTKLGGYIR